ncbi:YbaK/EbsC family protein [Nocardioides marmoraquaticus]
MEPLGSLGLVPALDRPDLLAEPVRTALEAWEHAAEVGVCEIDPTLADTAAMSEAYGVSLGASANCIVVEGSRGGEQRLAACVVRADTRADVNKRVRKLLDVRKCSFAPEDLATGTTGMQYGGITPVGLPGGVRLLLDDRVVEIGRAVVGSGLRTSKLVLPGRLLAALPGAEVVEDLAG